MKGIPDLNRAAFERGEQKLTEEGYEVVNPHRLSPRRTPDETDEDYYEHCMAVDLAALEACQAIAMLPHWQKSNGAKRELRRALELGLEVVDLERKSS